MSLLADSSPSKTLGKRLCESGGFNSYSFPSKFKHPNLDTFRSFPVNCGAARLKPNAAAAAAASALDCSAIACGKSASGIKCSKVDLARDSPEHCGPIASGINGRKSECSGNTENTTRRSEEKCEVAIAAVPLRSIPSVNAKRNPGKSVTSHGEDDDVGQKLDNNTENTVRHQEDSWERDSEKLAAIIAEAKEFINLFDVKYSTSKEFPAMKELLPEGRESESFYQPRSSRSDVYHEYNSIGKPKPLTETVKQEKRVREKIPAESAMLQNLDDGLSGKRMKIEDRSSKVVQEEKAFVLETKWEDNEEEVCVLSPAEWNMLQSCFNCKGDGAKSSIHKIEKKLEDWSSDKSSGKCRNTVESEGTKIVDLEGSCSVGTKSDQQSEHFPDCELTEARSGEENQEHSFMDSDEFSSVVKRVRDESPEKFSVDDNAIVVNSDISIKAAINFKNGPKYSENHKGLINLQIVRHEQPQGCKVMETLKLFEEQYVKLLREQKSQMREGKIKSAHFAAAEHVKAMGMYIFPEKPFGHVPGIEIGDEFQFRAELVVVGLHRQFNSGIDYVVLDGKKYATSIVNSGRYKNKAKADGVLIYSGQGGNPMLSNKPEDQKLERGNLALLNSMEMGYPVRVIYKRENLTASDTLGMSSERNFSYVYVYDGLYVVNKCQKERENQSGKLVFKFELHRMSGQPRTRESNAKSGKPRKCMEVCVLDDVSQGKEKFLVRAVNGVDDDFPLPFTYITNIVYPYWYQRIEPIGCNCTNGCSDSQQCPCVLKNGGEIPFNENGAIIRAKPRVHECGPSCKCPPSCMNRVSQHGPRYQLEIFKTKSRGWGVRSRNYISSGGFICEYIGELLGDKEAEQRVGNDEYLFDICKSHDEGGKGEFEGLPDSELKEDGFALDAAKCGNIGRFINHSCSPNLFAQNVLYDHDDERMPHIMFFASRDIPPLKELTYDYNYRVDFVCDVNGNIKKKDCYCGSRKCIGRMY